MKKEIYLVTGAAGFLGSNVCRLLFARGKRVRGLVLNGDPAEKYVPKGIEIAHGDLLDKASLERFFTTDGDDEVYVIHCASIVWVKVENLLDQDIIRQYQIFRKIRKGCI